VQDLILVVVKHEGQYRWYSSERDLWVLDWVKWARSFEDSGYSVPESDPSDRFGLPVVNENNANTFLAAIKQFEVTKQSLATLLAKEYTQAKSWWDVPHLFPVLFVNFDEQHLQAFYPDGTPLEQYAPDHWKSEFMDFADRLPADEKYWIQNGEDLLHKLIERGRNSSGG
jgi:hypothetical protein